MPVEVSSSVRRVSRVSRVSRASRVQSRIVVLQSCDSYVSFGWNCTL
jgi:hypothetical protein